jgi:Helix-turn-helix domain
VFEIGSSLREARVRKGLEIPEIETATKIRGKYLQALEDEQFDVLPGDTYIKGFLRTYAEYLGLDGQLYVDEYNTRYVAPDEMQTIRARRTAQATRQRRVQGGVLVAVLLGIALVTALVIIAWTAGSSSKQDVPGLSTPTVVHRPRHHVRKPATSSRIAHVTLRAIGTNVYLIAVRRGGPSGPILLQGTELAPGQTKSFKQQRLWIDTGTPANLQVVVNGKWVRFPGGKPQAFVVTKHGIFASA